MTHVAFVSVRNSFRPEMTLPQLAVWVERAWATTVAQAGSADRVVAVVNGEPIAAWRVRGAYPTDETYDLSNGDTRPRIGLSLGDPLPILPEYQPVPVLRRGINVVDLNVAPLPPERP